MGEKFEKILLYGDLHIGKSTIINNYIDFLNEHKISFGGYKTITNKKNSDICVYLSPFNFSTIYSNENLICEKNKYKFYPNVFDNYGVKILNEESKSNNILIFDEIGFIENQSKIYKYKLLEILKDKKFKIVGAIRKMNTELYNEILNIKNIKFIEVTISNRNDIKIENFT